MPTQNRDYLLIGVTGGIGAGKSLVCRLFARAGRTTISADAIGREISSDPVVAGQIREAFGAGILDGQGAIDRKALAAVVFDSPGRLQELNAIVHPAVFARIEKDIATLSVESRSPYVVIEAALIFESGMHSMLDHVMAVTADPEVRIRRVMERDGASREDVLRRIAAQLPQDEVRERADFVIQNDGDEASLARQVAFFDTLFHHMSRKDQLS